MEQTTRLVSPLISRGPNRKLPLMTRSILIALVLGCLSSLLAAQTPPNIVFVLADDIGYGDLGCYGATRTKTPNLDKLAAQGMRFTDAHAPASVCTPTRYAFLTGQYAFRHAPGSAILSGVAPLAIPTDRVTVPAFLKANGYTTGVVGKWHLGLGIDKTDYNAEIKPGPLEIGFDYAFIMPATGDRVPSVFVENRHVVGLDPKDPIQVSFGQPIGDEPTGKKNPELLKMKFSHGHDNTIHNGVSRIGYMAGGKAARFKDEDMADTFAARGVAFIEKNKGKPFFLYFATHDVHVPRVPNPRFAGKSGAGTRGDAVEEFDWTVGQIIDALDRLKLTDNTLIIVTSDNGGVIDDGYADGAPDHYKDDAQMSPNKPLKGFKGSLWEGGHRVPFIVRWPGKTPAGATSATTVCYIDMLATCSAIVGKPLPDKAGPDSFNMLPALTSPKPEKLDRPFLIHQTNGAKGPWAIRKGPWKLTPATGPGYAGPAGNRPMQLFNLDQDLGETRDMAKENPKIVEELTALLKQAREAEQTR